MQLELVPIRGNTYPIRSQLREMGGEFDRAAKVWMIPANRVADVKELLEPAPSKAAKAAKAKPSSSSPSAEPDIKTLDELMRAQFARLQNEVLFAGKWDAAAESRILDLATRIEGMGGNVAWVQRTLDVFGHRLAEKKRQKETR